MTSVFGGGVSPIPVPFVVVRVIRFNADRKWTLPHSEHLMPT
jgi:hypothetical protein